MDRVKLEFITNQLIPLLSKIPLNQQPSWGKMNPQQMLEHLELLFLISAGIEKQDLLTPEDQLPKYKAFLYSDKIFRENTKAPTSLIAENPFPEKYPDFTTAITKLQEAIRYFTNAFELNADLITVHPVFGPLNYSDWVLLHYKHVTHHARQFGLNA